MFTVCVLFLFLYSYVQLFSSCFVYSFPTLALNIKLWFVTFLLLFSLPSIGHCCGNQTETTRCPSLPSPMRPPPSPSFYVQIDPTSLPLFFFLFSSFPILFPFFPAADKLLLFTLSSFLGAECLPLSILTRPFRHTRWRENSYEQLHKWRFRLCFTISLFWFLIYYFYKF